MRSSVLWGKLGRKCGEERSHPWGPISSNLVKDRHLLSSFQIKSNYKILLQSLAQQIWKLVTILRNFKGQSSFENLILTTPLRYRQAPSQRSTWLEALMVFCSLIKPCFPPKAEEGSYKCTQQLQLKSRISWAQFSQPGSALIIIGNSFGN